MASPTNNNFESANEPQDSMYIDNRPIVAPCSDFINPDEAVQDGRSNSAEIAVRNNSSRAFQGEDSSDSSKPQDENNQTMNKICEICNQEDRVNVRSFSQEDDALKNANDKVATNFIDSDIVKLVPTDVENELHKNHEISTSDNSEDGKHSNDCDSVVPMHKDCALLVRETVFDVAKFTNHSHDQLTVDNMSIESETMKLNGDKYLLEMLATEYLGNLYSHHFWHPSIWTFGFTIITSGLEDTIVHRAGKVFLIQRKKHDHSKPTKLELHAFIKGKKNAKRQKICTIIVFQYSSDLNDDVHEGSLLHEEQFTEVPQFVDLTGKVSDVANDPPGQQSIYIPPGDNRREAYRLSTFDSFPCTAPVNIVDLAKKGFFYTGFGDRVKCYSCGRTVEKWEVTDNPTERRWHKPDCPFVQGQATDNVPITGIFNQAFAASRRNNASPQAVGTSQNFNGPVVNFGSDLGDRLSRGGTYQIQPGNGLFISPTAPPIPTGPAAAPGPNHAPVRQWRMANVISADHRRYLTNLYLTRELDRLASFCRWPTGRPNVAPVALARAGFFYLGDMDRTQCFSCGGVLRNWTAEDDAFDEHQTHFPTCPFILGNDHRNVPIPQVQETQQQLSDAYPCRYPANPHMRSEAARAETFDRRWPMNRTRAPPSEIAEAGFFFLGERDRVKCFYCNGGLQNWEFDDKPWIEHAKWFPNCQFLLRRQGQFFVYRHLSLSPHLPRPIIGRQEGATIDPAPPGELRRGQDVPPITAGTRARGPTPPPTIIDPQEEMRKRKERVDKEMRENNNVKMVIAFGYEERVVRKVLEEQLEAEHAADSENIFNGMEPLLDAVQAREADIKRELEEEEHATRVKEVEQPMSVTFPSISSNYSEMSMSTMETLSSVASHASGAVNVSGFEHDSDDEDMTDLYGSVVEGPSIGAAAAGPSMVSTSTMPYQAIDIPDDPESIKEMIEQKKEERLCKICFTEQADMVFIPCSHMCCCKECTQAIRQCPVCRKKIEKAIRTYLK